jgi:hypothetical protein
LPICGDWREGPHERDRHSDLLAGDRPTHRSIGDLMVKDLPKPGKPPLVRARAALKVAIDQGQTVDPIETVYVLAFVRALIDLAIADAQKRRPVV